MYRTSSCRVSELPIFLDEKCAWMTKVDQALKRIYREQVDTMFKRSDAFWQRLTSRYNRRLQA